MDPPPRAFLEVGVEPPSELGVAVSPPPLMEGEGELEGVGPPTPFMATEGELRGVGVVPEVEVALSGGGEGVVEGEAD